MAFSEVSAAPPAKRSSRSRAEAFFFPLMAVLFVATVFLGFARTFFLAPMYHYELPSPLVAVHGAVFSAWIALFAVQATLAPAGRPDLHKRLGVAGAYLLGVVVLLGCLIMLEGLRSDVSRPGLDQPRIFALNLERQTAQGQSAEQRRWQHPRPGWSDGFCRAFRVAIRCTFSTTPASFSNPS
jgi:hypothetical protein